MATFGYEMSRAVFERTRHLIERKITPEIVVAERWSALRGLVITTLLATAFFYLPVYAICKVLLMVWTAMFGSLAYGRVLGRVAYWCGLFIPFSPLLVGSAIHLVAGR